MDVTLKMSAKSKAMLKRMPEVVSPAIFKGLQDGMLMIEGRAKDPYLTGKALKVQTGHLRRSVSTSVKRKGDKIIGTIGTNVVYGRFWEMGFTGNVKVRRHRRRISKAFGKKIKPKTITVGAHNRWVDEDARPFMSPAIKDMLPHVRDIIAQRILEAVK